MSNRFIPGQKLRAIPGGTLNRALDVLDRLGQFAPPPGPGDARRPADTPILVVPVKNMTGANLVERAIVGIDQSALTPPDIAGDADEADAAVLSGVPVEVVAPDAAEHRNAWAVTVGPIGADQVGHAVITGAVWARVNVTDADHKFANIQTGDSKYLASSGSGAAIWYRKPGTGKRWALILLGGGAENYRLLRGQSFGAQSGATILLDNVSVLAGGLDPSGGNPAALVEVANIFSQSYADNELVNAVYSAEETGGAGVHWETLKTNTGTDTYRAARGLVKGDVTADDASFMIDNVLPLAGGLDPVSGNPATEVAVQNIQKEAFEDNTPVTCVYDGSNWELLLVERYRMLRGEAYASVTSGTATFAIDAIKILGSGLDPRADPTSATEQVTVSNIHADTYAANDKVVAVFNVQDNVWEALPRTSSGGGIAKIGKADSTISARSGSTAASGTVSVWSISGTTLADTGNDETWYNISGQSVTGGVFIQAKEIDGQMVIDFEDCA